jgi:hypothetical protein
MRRDIGKSEVFIHPLVARKSTMKSSISDFSEHDKQVVTETLVGRYGRVVPAEWAEAEVQLTPESDELTICPALYWEGRGAHFVVIKLGDNRYKGQFYYSEAQQYGTGHDSFDSLGDCVVTLLQIQADHERQMDSLRTGLAAVKPSDEDDNGPVIL